MDKINEKRVPNSWLKAEIQTQRGYFLDKVRKIKSKDKPNVIPELLSRLIERAGEVYPGKYVSTSQLAKYVKIGEDMELRKVILNRNIQPVRKKMLKEGRLLSNRPGYGYRVDVEQDLVFEVIKKVESSMSSIVNSIMVLSNVKYDKNSFTKDQIEALNSCRNIILNIIPILEEFDKNRAKNKVMNKYRKEIDGLKHYLDNLLSSDEF